MESHSQLLFILLLVVLQTFDKPPITQYEPGGFFKGFSHFVWNSHMGYYPITNRFIWLLRMKRNSEKNLTKSLREEVEENEHP